MNKWLALIAFSVFSIGAFSYLPSVNAHGNVDQSMTGPFAGFGVVSTNILIVQEFTPTVSSLVAVDVFLQPNPKAGGGTTETLTVDIRFGSINGAILGSSSKVLTVADGDPIAAQHFDFDPPVSLTSGSIHVITVKTQSTAIFNWLIRDGDPYPGGSAIPFQSPPFNNPDLGFATYFSPLVGGDLIPIESTSLILAGAQSFSWMIPVVLSVIGIGLFVFRKSE